MVEPFAAPLVAWAFAIETKPSPNHLHDGFVECAAEGLFLNYGYWPSKKIN